MDRWKTYLCLCSFCVETTNQTIICKGNHPKLAEPWNGWILKMKPDATHVYKPAILKSCHVGYIKFQSTLPPHHRQFIGRIAKPPMRVVGEWSSWDNFQSKKSHHTIFAVPRGFNHCESDAKIRGLLKQYHQHQACFNRWKEHGHDKDK